MAPYVHLIVNYERHRDVSSAKRFLREMVRVIGPGFHPDTPVDDYVYVADSSRKLFSPEFANRLQIVMNEVLLVLEKAGIDPSAVALPVARRLLFAG